MTRVGTDLCGGRKPQVRKVRKGSWTATKRNRFIEELAVTCNVSASLRKVRMSAASVYDLRKRSAEFRARWAEALREGYAKLEMMLLERAINGTVKTVTRAGGAIDKIHEYPNGLALTLLKMHKDQVAVAEAEHHPDEMDEVRKRILRKIAAVRKRKETKGAGGIAHPQPLPPAGGEEKGKLPPAAAEDEA